MANRNEIILRNTIKRQKARVTAKRFSSLIETPQVLSGGAAPATSSTLSLPASGRLGVSYSVAVLAGQLQAGTSTGRTLGTPALSADEVYDIGYFDEDVELDLEITAAVSGTATLHFLDDWRTANAIATAVFT
jgi:hypothetical protein